MRHHTESLTPNKEASIDRAPRHLLDQEIRGFKIGDNQKYTIASRPKNGPARWRLRRSDITFTEEEIIRRENIGVV